MKNDSDTPDKVILLLSCMDYRLIDQIQRYMTGRGLRNKYYHIILAGASLGVITDQQPAWSETFWEHVDLAIKLSQINEVMVMDHRDCGAYKLILGEDFVEDRERETAIHAESLKDLSQQIHQKYPTMKVELLLMDLDGSIEKIS